MSTNSKKFHNTYGADAVVTMSHDGEHFSVSHGDSLSPKVWLDAKVWQEINEWLTNRKMLDAMAEKARDEEHYINSIQTGVPAVKGYRYKVTVEKTEEPLAYETK